MVSRTRPTKVNSAPVAEIIVQAPLGHVQPPSRVAPGKEYLGTGWKEAGPGQKQVGGGRECGRAGQKCGRPGRECWRAGRQYLRPGKFVEAREKISRIAVNTSITLANWYLHRDKKVVSGVLQVFLRGLSTTIRKHSPDAPQVSLTSSLPRHNEKSLRNWNWEDIARGNSKIFRSPA
jgi:hypothetical protein